MLNQETSTTIVGQRYQVGDYLGHGGMGTVYRAYDRLAGEWVALKRITAPTKQLAFSSSSGSTDLRLSLANEFQVLASLRHPNIIGVLDYGFDVQKLPFFTMDLIEERSNILEAGSDLDMQGQVNLIVQMLQALVYLHRRRVIHRDLKPGNVLVKNGIIKVLDFGLSIRRTPETNRPDSSAGTLNYMAPEVFKGEDVSEASDLYAVGVMTYQLFAKRQTMK